MPKMTVNLRAPEERAFQGGFQNKSKRKASGLPGAGRGWPSSGLGSAAARVRALVPQPPSHPGDPRGRGAGKGSAPGRGAVGSLGVPAGGHSGGRGAMEAPAELLAALPVLATALALLLAWLLVRRGAAASAEPVSPAKAPGTPAPPDPCAPEPAAAPEGPGELEGPGEREAAPAEAEEQAAEARQVRTRPSRAPPPHPGALLPLPLARAGPGTGPPAPPPPGSAEPASKLAILPPRSVGERRAYRSCAVCSARGPLPGPGSLLPWLGSHPPLAPHPSGPRVPGSTCMWLISRSAVMRVVWITKK